MSEKLRKMRGALGPRLKFEDLCITSESGKLYSLKMTCSACPEQYDVYLNSTQVAYFRLRHDCFRVDCPDADQEIVYETETNGDGAFDDEEKHQQLKAAIEAVDKWVTSNGD